MQCNWRLPDEKRDGVVVSWWNCQLQFGHKEKHEPARRLYEAGYRSAEKERTAAALAKAAWESGPEIPEVNRG